MNESKLKDYLDEFSGALGRLGVHEGSVVYVGSDATKILLGAVRELELNGKEEQYLFLDAFIDALKSKVTERGTLLFPVYSWAFCKGVAFDYKNTQGQVGFLNNYILNNRMDFRRTKHPLYSLMVWGRDADMLCMLDNQNAWCGNTPYSYLHRNKGIELDLSTTTLRSMTFKHYVEESIHVPYRYPKFFMGEYIDADGNSEIRTYSMYVRNLNVQMESCQNDEFYLEGNTAVKEKFHGWDMIAVDLPRAYELMKDDFLNNGGKNIYRFTDYEIDWSDNDKFYEIGYLKNMRLLGEQK